MADSPAADTATDPRFAPRPDSASLDAATMFDLSGRVAIVTGGSRGNGLSIACGFAAQGAKVVVANRKADACDVAVTEISEAGSEALAVPVHMGDLESVNRLADATLEHYGQVDILVNNAANPLGLPMEDITPEAMDRMAELSHIGRIGHPDELVGAALLLASDAGSYITGQCIIVDGGFVPAR